MTRRLVQISLLFFGVAVFTAAAHACPMCKDSLANVKNDLQQTGSVSLNGAFNKSIITMILGFFGALGIVAFNLVRGIRK